MENQQNIEIAIKKYALENAAKFNGKANPSAIVGQIIREFPNAKSDMKSVNQQIQFIVQEINSLSLEQQAKLLEELNPNFKEQQQEKKQAAKESRKNLPPLRNAIDGKVITRMPPGPSKYTHAGHAVSFLINYMYAQEYNGQCILRFDDTNPDVDRQEYIDSIKDDLLNYLELKPSKIIQASNDMDKFIDFANKLVEEEKVYTCNCPSESISLNRRNQEECTHRNQPIEQTKVDWQNMIKGTNQDTILRLKIDMQHKNAVMRDPAIYRVNTTTHYNQKNNFNVWPLYDFESAIEDGLNQVTHVLRSNEFDSRIELHNYIADLFNLPNPEYKHYGRVSISDATTKGREIKQLIESGDYLGWDDPRLVTLQALKRRGIVKESFIELTKTAGLSKSATLIDYTVIAAINRQLLDKSSKRFYFIENPVQLTIANAPDQELKLDLHPDNTKGGRYFRTNQEFIIEDKDYQNIIKSKEQVRLIDCLNFQPTDNQTGTFTSTNFTEFTGKEKIHWLPKEESQHKKVEILMPDISKKIGITEIAIEILKVGDVIQFERFGFCRLDEINADGTYKFWFTHK